MILKTNHRAEILEQVLENKGVDFHKGNFEI